MKVYERDVSTDKLRKDLHGTSKYFVLKDRRSFFSSHTQCASSSRFVDESKDESSEARDGWLVWKSIIVASFRNSDGILIHHFKYNAHLQTSMRRSKRLRRKIQRRMSGCVHDVAGPLSLIRFSGRRKWSPPASVERLGHETRFHQQHPYLEETHLVPISQLLFHFESLSP